jgi:hypothetical protein
MGNMVLKYDTPPHIPHIPYTVHIHIHSTYSIYTHIYTYIMIYIYIYIHSMMYYFILCFVILCHEIYNYFIIYVDIVGQIGHGGQPLSFRPPPGEGAAVRFMYALESMKVSHANELGPI